MAKRSSRKSSSGDEALLWGIAAVVVAIVGVGTAIMLTRPGKADPIGPTPKPEKKPVQTDTSCYRELRQGTDKDIKYFVQKEQNMKQANGNCPQGWAAEPNANNLKAGTYQTIEVSKKNQCYNNYLMPPDYKTTNCLQAGDCDTTTSFTDSKCNNPWTPPCTVQGGNGTCMSKTNTQGKRNCVSANQLCGVNLDAHTQNPDHRDEKTCEDIFDKYNEKMITCNNGYTAYVEKDGQGNCLFKCADDKQGQCCAPSGLAIGVCAEFTTKNACAGSCNWQPRGCKKENFRMRRRRR
jgi:hypothetical protein